MKLGNQTESSKNSEKKPEIGFWQWLFFGTGKKPGISRIARPALFLDVVIGCGLANIIKMPVEQVFSKFLLPAGGIFFALAIAWGSTVTSLATSSEIRLIAKRNPGGIQEYVYPFQLGMLIVLFVIVIWSAVSTTLIDTPGRESRGVYDWIFVFFIYSLIPFSLRTVWQIINIVSTNIIVITFLRDRLDEHEGNNS